MQVKHRDQDVEPYATKYSCSTHQVTYYTPASTNEKCPVCDLERQLQETKRALLEATNQLATMQNQFNRTQQQLDLVTAMRSALDIIDEHDLVWLKAVLYQYKLDKSVTLRVSHGKPAGAKALKSKKRLPPNGFMSIPRVGDPDALSCTSLGGLALAEYYEEAMNSSGSAQAMSMMMRAFWKELPGASE